MNKKKRKFYVVWAGVNPGIYDTWDECKQQVNNYPAAKYKSFESRDEAETALASGPWEYMGKKSEKNERRPDWHTLPTDRQPIILSLSVDAACSGNPGPTEYRGVMTHNGQEMFRIGPLADGNNNVGEFLAIVHGLAWLQQQGPQFDHFPIYSDSRTARSWVRKRKALTQLRPTARNAQVFELIRRAETWLHTHQWNNPIYTWETELWGEIPADFGRK